MTLDHERLKLTKFPDNMHTLRRAMSIFVYYSQDHFSLRKDTLIDFPLSSDICTRSSAATEAFRNLKKIK